MNHHKQILRLAIPSTLANITIPLVGLVDMAIVGHIDNAIAIGGIAIGTMLFDLLYWNFSFLRVGTGGMTAQAYGRQDTHECARLLSQSIGIAVLGTALIWALQWVFVQAVLWCTPCSNEVADFARQYFFIRIWAAPATLSLMACKGWWIGMQDTVSPMKTDILVNAVNIVASYGLAVHTPLGALGVAYGTVMAQYSGLALAVGIMAVRYRHVIRRIVWRQTMWDFKSMRKLLILNANLVIRSLCFLVVYVGFTALASRYGDGPLAAYSMMMKLFMLVSYMVDGFAYAAEALVGKAFGAKDWNQIPVLKRQLWLWAAGVAGIITWVFVVCSLPMGEHSTGLVYRLMTTDATVQDLMQILTPWLIAMPVVSTLAFMWDGMYTGATAGKEIRNTMIWAAGAFIIGYLLTQPWAGLHALMIAYFAHLVARVVYQSAVWPKVMKERINEN